MIVVVVVANMIYIEVVIVLFFFRVIRVGASIFLLLCGSGSSISSGNRGGVDGIHKRARA